MQSNLDELERALGYGFSNRSLLARAVTHSSSANETQPAPAQPEEAQADNERLEFLGDAILGLLVSESLFHRFEGYTEGQLSVLKNHLVSATHLLAVAHTLDLGRYLHLGRGEETAGGRSKQRLLVNAFEAVLAAVYLDGGMDAARELLMRCALLSRRGTGAACRLRPSGRTFAPSSSVSPATANWPAPCTSSWEKTVPAMPELFTVEVRVGKDSQSPLKPLLKRRPPPTTPHAKSANYSANKLCGSASALISVRSYLQQPEHPPARRGSSPSASANASPGYAQPS